jgi:lipopolysaccharide transport system ATP-binding protein
VLISIQYYKVFEGYLKQTGMTKVVIRAEGLSKRYKLGTIGTGTLRHDLNQWWAKLQGKEDPYAIIDTEASCYVGKNDFWALQDINFDIKQGEAVGIIGKNGAGKSTLLKILSRVTIPTAGEIRVKGRIVSLLEVGTGFHPELTGKENIFLNGAILGMSRREIKSKLDEIIAFSGVERHIDTPVKRYSSGMYVRLAFAVAAHLEPEILIVDEVLAVGDADFQKKCLGKMHEVSQKQGRTVLFVSHNIQAVKNLCDKAMWLHQGRLKVMGEVSTVVNKYTSSTKQFNSIRTWDDPKQAPGNNYIRFKQVELIPALTDPDDPIDIRTPLTVKFQFWNMMPGQVQLSMELGLFSYGGECIFDVPSPVSRCQKGLVAGQCTIPGNFLNNGSYYINLYVVKDTTTTLFEYEECLSFDLEDFRGDIQWYGKWSGAVRPKLPFKIEQVNYILQ